MTQAQAGGEHIDLSLVSHTNVGKTTLARTLLRRDVGEVADRAHITEQSEAHVLIDSAQGDALRLWDTPGFGDSARLLKRLRMSDNPIGWLLTQVWDRFTDRPFYSSQQAIRNVRDESDVVLYLVNAAEDPASAAYVEVEMQILGWIGKPVLLLLNQMGAPRGAAAEAADEAAWRQHLAAYPWVKGAIALDAFARCWVQEDELLACVEAALAADQRSAFSRLRAAWRARNLEVFNASMHTLATQLAEVAVDRESLEARGLKAKAGSWLAGLVSGREKPDAQTERAMQKLGERLDQRVRVATDRLIALHGLSGSAAQEILSRVAGQFDVSNRADVGSSGVIGGVVSGALGGLAADLAAGGLTFGAGALIGGILGALGGSGVAHAYNLARGDRDGNIGWSAAFLLQRFDAALLRYLAVAHFGRGRGDWAQGEYPPHWHALVAEVTSVHRDALTAIFASMDQRELGAETLAAALEPIVSASGREVLEHLYPGASAIFATAAQPAPPAAAAVTSRA
jgi:hypothetical protein